MLFKGSTIFWTVKEQMIKVIRSTAMAVMKKSWKVCWRNSITEVASLATKRKPVGTLEETNSPVFWSRTRGERISLVT